jgi:hypothetical protein
VRLLCDRNFALYDAPLWNMALIASRFIWCGSRPSAVGWNTFPVPTLTEQNKADLTRCAEDILLAREAHFPATIADLYDPDNMPENLRHAHEQNDEVLERIYIGRRFRNDTERLEKLFEMYTKMTAAQAPAKKTRKTARDDDGQPDQQKTIPSVSITTARTGIEQGQRAGHAADAGARLRKARRAVSCSSSRRRPRARAAR